MGDFLSENNLYRRHEESHYCGNLKNQYEWHEDNKIPVFGFVTEDGHPGYAADASAHYGKYEKHGFRCTEPVLF